MQQFNIEQKEEYKETELGFLPESWEVLDIGDVTNIVNKKGEIGKLPYVEIGDININSKKYNCKGKKSIKGCKKAFKNNVIISRVRPTRGAISIIKEEEIEVSSAFAILSEKPKLNIKYFFLVLAYNKNFFEYMKKVQRGSNYPSCRKEDILRFKIPLPSIPEQKKVAFVLSTIQEAKEKTENVINSLKEFKKSMMKHLFTYGPFNLENLDRIQLKRSDIALFPIYWKCKRLEQLAKIDYGIQAAVAHLKEKTIGIPILTNINIKKEGTIDTSIIRYYNLQEDKKNKVLEKGDILFNWRSGSSSHVGKTALFNLDGQFTFSSFILRFKPYQEIKNEFLFYYLNYLKDLGYFIQKKDQSSVNSVFNASKSKKIPIFFPNSEIQDSILSILSKLDNRIKIGIKYKNSLEELFKSTLHNLMTAKIRVNKLEI